MAGFLPTTKRSTTCGRYERPTLCANRTATNSPWIIPQAVTNPRIEQKVQKIEKELTVQGSCGWSGVVSGGIGFGSGFGAFGEVVPCWPKGPCCGCWPSGADPAGGVLPKVITSF